MENSPILRSLVAGGRSSGTGRPTSSPSSARSTKHAEEQRGAAFERQVDRHVERQNERVRPEREDELDASRARRDERRDAKVAEAIQPQAADERAPHEFDESAALSLDSDTLSGESPLSADDAPSAPSDTSDLADGAPTKPGGANPGAANTAAANATAANTEASVAANPTTAAASNAGPATASELLAAQNTSDGSVPATAAGATSDKRGGASTTAAVDGANAATEAGAEAPLDMLDAGATTEGASADPAGGEVLAKAGEPELNLAKLAGAKGGEAAASTDGARAPGGIELASRSAESASAPSPEPKPESASATLDADGAADVLRQVRLRFSPEMRQAVIQLEPRELGRIAIRISVARGVVRAEMRAENAAALEALERHAPELRAALERVGLGAESFSLQLGFEGGPQQHDGFGAAARDPHGPSTRTPSPERELPAHQMRSLAQRLAASGGVDTYA
jgi:flagellar hook-length control protein FliK